MSNTPTININTSRNWFWPLVAIACLFFGLIAASKCNNRDTQVAQAKAQNDSLDARSSRLQAHIIQDSIDHEKLIKSVVRDRSIYIHNADSAWFQLGKLQRAYNGLSGRILVQQPTPADTAGWALFSLRCDSCATALQLGSRAVDSLKLADSLANALYQYEISIRSQYEADQMKLTDSCMAQNMARSKLFNQLYESTKPRGSLKGGISLQYSQSYQQAGIWLMYDAKNGKCYGGGLNYNSFNKPCYEVRAGFTIFGK